MNPGDMITLRIIPFGKIRGKEAQALNIIVYNSYI